MLAPAQEAARDRRIIGALREAETLRSKAAIVFGARHFIPLPQPTISSRASGFQFFVPIHKILQLNRFQVETLAIPRQGTLEGCSMQDAKSYRQYANDCRCIAATMSAKDKAVLLEMAKVWDDRAEEAERSKRSGSKDAWRPVDGSEGMT